MLIVSEKSWPDRSPEHEQEGWTFCRRLGQILIRPDHYLSQAFGLHIGRHSGFLRSSLKNVVGQASRLPWDRLAPVFSRARRPFIRRPEARATNFHTRAQSSARASRGAGSVESGLEVEPVASNRSSQRSIQANVLATGIRRW